jgi:putative SOS response-associated peptidase YedK
MGVWPTWRGPSQAKHRCLILVDGFYEWKWLNDKGKQKQPFAIVRTDGQMTVMAGLWEGWRSKDSSETIRSCTIATAPANELMSEIHNHGKRMPVILEKADWPVWHGEVEADLGDVKALMRPAEEGVLRA